MCGQLLHSQVPRGGIPRIAPRFARGAFRSILDPLWV